MKSFFHPLCQAITVSVVIGLVGCNKVPEAPAIAAPNIATAANVSDADITNHVTTALLQEVTLKGFNIEVITTKGDVRLIGVVDTQSQIDTAIKLSREAEGAHTVHDELTIKK